MDVLNPVKLPAGTTGHQVQRYLESSQPTVTDRLIQQAIYQVLMPIFEPEFSDERKLKLKVNQKKSQVADANEVTFLGFVFVGTKIRWSDKSFQKFKRKVKELSGRSWFVSMEYRYKKWLPP